MSNWALDDVKRDVQNLKYELTRKVDDETFRRKMHDLESRVDRLESSLQNQIEELQRLINGVIESNNLTDGR